MKYHHDQEEADKVIKFVTKYCTHVKGDLAGQPFIPMEYEQKMISDIFGTKRPDGTRRYRTAYIELPRKNDKTTLFTSLGLYMLFADGEKGGEVYSAAANKEQANISFTIAKLMVEQNDYMMTKSEALKKSIWVPGTNSSFMSLSKESKTKHGLNASCVIVDELHAHPDRELYDVLATSVGTRSQPLVFIITTAGLKDESSIGWIMHQKAQKIIAGKVKDDSFYAVIYGADEKDDPSKEATWMKANPGYGMSVKKEYLRDQWNRIKTEPSFLNTFKRLHLNIWTGSYEAFLAPEDWDKCNKYPLSIEDFHGQDVIAALDLAATSDFNAIGLISYFDDMYQFYPLFFIPEDTVNKRHNAIQMRSWIDEGYIFTTPGNVSDYRFIQAKFNELMDDGVNFIEISYDPWNARQLCNEMMEDGFNMLEVRQGFRTMSPYMDEVQRIVEGGLLNHGGHPVLTWMNDNLVAAKDASDNRKPDKKKSSDKIDGMVTFIMALGRIVLGTQDEPTGTLYDEQDGINV